MNTKLSPILVAAVNLRASLSSLLVVALALPLAAPAQRRRRRAVAAAFPWAPYLPIWGPKDRHAANTSVTNDGIPRTTLGFLDACSSPSSGSAFHQPTNMRARTNLAVRRTPGNPSNDGGANNHEASDSNGKDKPRGGV